jgi:hypothetical protein
VPLASRSDWPGVAAATTRRPLVATVTVTAATVAVTATVTVMAMAATVMAPAAMATGVPYIYL